MKKSILNLGKALHRAEQKSINGGFDGEHLCFPIPRDQHNCFEYGSQFVIVGNCCVIQS